MLGDSRATVTITLTAGTGQDRLSVQVVKRDGKWYIQP